MRVIAPDDNQIGIITLEDALGKAKGYGLDLVEVDPNSSPPVCRVMDYGRFRVNRSKRLSENKKKHRSVNTKHIRLRPKIGEHDFNIKLRQAIGFLANGDRVRVAVFFRGREVIHQDIGRGMLEKFKDGCADNGTVDAPMKYEGRSWSFTLVPAKSKH